MAINDKQIHQAFVEVLKGIIKDMNRNSRLKPVANPIEILKDMRCRA